DGEHIAVFTAPVAYDIGRSWEQEQDRFLEETLDLCERHLPGFVGGVEILAVSTPHAFQRFTLNEDGAMVGWATTPDQSGSRRLSNLTPIEGLYLAGHWTQPGSSALRAMISGFHVAQLLLEQAGEEVPQIPLAIDVRWQ